MRQERTTIAKLQLYDTAVGGDWCVCRPRGTQHGADEHQADHRADYRPNGRRQRQAPLAGKAVGGATINGIGLQAKNGKLINDGTCDVYGNAAATAS